jgi:hypothetical protein
MEFIRLFELTGNTPLIMAKGGKVIKNHDKRRRTSWSE